MKLRCVLLAMLASCSLHTGKDTGLFEPGVSTGLIDNRLPEASGLAGSVTNPGNFWSLNDGENPSEVYLIDTTGQVKMTCKLAVPNRDWEEVAVGPGPIEGKTYVYVGDIGDNKAVFDIKYIYRFEEPVAGADELSVSIADTLQISIEDGVRDTETMMIDPYSNDLYLVSKREDSVRVYKVAYPFGRGLLTAKKMTTVPFRNIVAGAFSPDGSEVLLKDYDHIYYWKRGRGEPLEEVLRRPSQEVPYEREAQGESIAWSRDGQSFYTLSETNKDKPAYLMHYRRK